VAAGMVTTFFSTETRHHAAPPSPEPVP